MKVAYVSQKAWLLNATLQDNVLFGLPMNNALYNHVLDICALEPDLATLVAGDQTEIGEKVTQHCVAGGFFLQFCT